MSEIMFIMCMFIYAIIILSGIVMYLQGLPHRRSR